MLPEAVRARVRSPRVWLFGGLWLSLAVAAVVLRAALVPFILAALIAYIIDPAIGWLTRLPLPRGKRLPRWGALVGTYAAFFLVAYLFLTTLVPRLYREVVHVSHDVVGFANALTPERVQAISLRAESWLGERGIPVELSAHAEGQTPHRLNLTIDPDKLLRDGVTGLSDTLRQNLAAIVRVSRKVAQGLFAAVFLLLMVLMIAAFLSIDVAGIRRYAGTLLPAQWRPDASRLVHRVDRALSGVVRGQLTIAVINGALTFLGLLIFGVKFAFLLATSATLFSLVPIFGTIVGSVPILLVALSHTWHAAVGMLVWICGIHALEAYLLNPKILGSAAKIHPVVVVFALLAGERVGGLVGVLFSLPVCAVLVACFEFARERAQATQPG